MRDHAAVIDLNADLGEGFPSDARLLELVTSAGVSCGAHAGDREAILATLVAARSRGVAVGAHPGFPDRAGFGRVERAVTAAEVAWLVAVQVADLARLAREAGVVLQFVKPHGALYNQAQREPETARGVVDAIAVLGLPVLGQPGGALEHRARAASLRFVAEGFPERRYEPDGRLAPRTQPDAVLNDPAQVAAQVLRLVRQGLDTLCLHGDDPAAVAKAENVLCVLRRHHITPRFWG